MRAWRNYNREQFLEDYLNFYALLVQLKSFAVAVSIFTIVLSMPYSTIKINFGTHCLSFFTCPNGAITTWLHAMVKMRNILSMPYSTIKIYYSPI